MEKYRVEFNSVYELDEKENAYVFIGRLVNETLEEFVKNYEENYYMQSYEWDED